MNLLTIGLQFALTFLIDQCRSFSLPDRRIVGGRSTTSEHFPFIALIEIEHIESNMLYHHYCGGSIIDPTWILTAAHCFDKKVNFTLDLTVFAGIDRLYQMSSKIPSVRSVELELSHEEYNEDTNDNDISLLKLLQPLEWTERIQKIYLPRFSREETHHDKALIVGFGKTNENYTNPSNKLMMAKVDIFPEQEAACLLDSKYKPENMICAGLKEGGRDTCQGDSGGPLIVHRITGSPVVIGIVSFAREGCGRKDSPGYYTRVSRYLEWIRKIMKENE